MQGFGLVPARLHVRLDVGRSMGTTGAVRQPIPTRGRPLAGWARPLTGAPERASAGRLTGLAAAAFAQLAGAARVIIVGGPERPLAAAAAAGIGDVHLNIVDAADAEAVLREARAAAGPDGADLVIECAGVPGAVAQGLTLARRGGSYLVRSCTGSSTWSGRGPSPALTSSNT